MGSLPNLRSLSNDPNTVYSYELCDPENVTFPAEKYGKRFPLICNAKGRGDFESLGEVNKIKNVDPYLGSNFAAMAKLQLHHRRVRHTHSCGLQYNCHIQNATANCDDYLMQLSANSPISSRSSRSNVTWTVNNTLSNPNHVSAKRKDSLNSSGGTSSVRRLIAVVRSTPSKLGPVYSRKVLCRNFAALCLGHATVTAALLPLICLQSSVSAWWWPQDSLRQSPDVGSLLLSGSFAVATIFTLFSPIVIHILGCNGTLVCCYVCASAFFVAHLYPTVKSLMPAYLLLGICLGPMTCARVSFAVTLSHKLTYVMTDEEELHEKIHGEIKESILQKLCRGLQASQDLGMVVGNIIVWCFLFYSRDINQEKTVLKTFFNEDESGERICGSRSSPNFDRPFSNYVFSENSTRYETLLVPCKTSAMLTSVFVGCGMVAVALTAAFTNKIRLFLYQDPLERPHGVAVYHALRNAFKDPILQLAAPMSLFVGLHQGFIYSDFGKWYVACSLGIPNINLAFLCMGLLQTVAAFTLSLLLQNVPRYLVIVAGFIFHSCLILVLLLWKPSGDDAALFYVIAAAWGVCSIIWETLNFNLLLRFYPDFTWQMAFVHENIFKFLGLSAAFGVHGILPTRLKLYALAVFMLVATGSHTWLEMKLKAKKKPKSELNTL